MTTFKKEEHFDGYILLTEDGYSGAINFSQHARAGFQVVTENTDAAGTIRIQGTNDNSFSETNWINLDMDCTSSEETVGDGYAISSGTDINKILAVNQEANWLRIKWEYVSGRGGLHWFVSRKKV